MKLDVAYTFFLANCVAIIKHFRDEFLCCACHVTKNVEPIWLLSLCETNPYRMFSIGLAEEEAPKNKNNMSTW